MFLLEPPSLALSGEGRGESAASGRGSRASQNTLTHSPHTPAQVNPLKALVEFIAESRCSGELCPGPPHPFTQDRTWALESSRHAGLEPALSLSLPICEMEVMSECQGHISCRVSHLFNAHAQPRAFKGSSLLRNLAVRSRHVGCTCWGAGNCPLFCLSHSGFRPVSLAPTWGSAQGRGNFLRISFLSCCFSLSQSQVPDNGCHPMAWRQEIGSALQGVRVTRWGQRLPLFLPSARLACMHAKSLRRV